MHFREESHPEMGDEEMGLGQEREPLLDKRKPEAILIAELGGSDVVEFASSIFYAQEEEGVLTLDIIRLGTMKGRVAVKYYTGDASAMAHTNYMPASGQVIFESGEAVKTVSITVLDDDRWTATQEFKLTLCEPQNCHLSGYLYQCRVKILNVEVFPTDDFKEEAAALIKSSPTDKVSEEEEDKERHNDWALHRAYCELNFYSANLQWQTIFVLICDQIGSLVLFGTLYISVYIVDTIFGRGPSSEPLLFPDRYHTAIVVSTWYVIPYLMVYLWDLLKANIDITGLSREFLQMSLIRTSMDYTQDSRYKVSAGDLQVAMIVDAEVIAMSYTAALNIIGLLGRVLTLLLFIKFYQNDTLAINSALLIIGILCLIIALKIKSARNTTQVYQQALLELGTQVDEANQKYRIFSDYSKRGLMIDMFHEAVTDCTDAKIPSNMVMITNGHRTRLITGIVIANYIIQRTPAVLAGEVSLGIFLATITIFNSFFFDTMSDLDKQLMLVVDALVPLRGVTKYLNMPLELTELRTIDVDRRTKTTVFRTQIADPTKSDQIPILISNLCHEYTAGAPILEDVNLTIAQGQLVAITGPQNSGKATLIGILANVIAPTSGNVFIPSFLRVLHVTREPVLLQTSMLHNLALGLPSKQTCQKFDRERVIDILKLLDLPGVIDMVNNEPHDGAPWQAHRIKFTDPSEATWEQTFTHSQKIKVHLARALIANPEVLIIQRTLQGLNEETSTMIVNLLHQHIAERGLCLPAEGRSERALRTVILSTESRALLGQADMVFTLDPKTKTVITKGSRSQGVLGCFPPIMK